MKTSETVLKEIEKLYNEYAKEVEDAKKEGLLTEKTAHTYLLHPANFIKWCKGQFEPGEKNR